METRSCGMGFFGRMPFGMGAGKGLFEKWGQMTIEEKVEWMDQHTGSAGSDEPMGFHGGFDVAGMDRRCEEWLKMPVGEKEAFVKERKEMMNVFSRHRRDYMDVGAGPHNGCSGGRHHKWAGMTTGEKQEMIRKWDEMMMHHENFSGYSSGSGKYQAENK